MILLKIVVAKNVISGWHHSSCVDRLYRDYHSTWSQSQLKKKTQHKETSLLFETFSFIVLEPFVVLNSAV